MLNRRNNTLKTSADKENQAERFDLLNPSSCADFTSGYIFGAIGKNCQR